MTPPKSSFKLSSINLTKDPVNASFRVSSTFRKIAEGDAPKSTYRASETMNIIEQDDELELKMGSN
jgi:hypothetical protein